MTFFLLLEWIIKVDVGLPARGIQADLVHDASLELTVMKYHCGLSVPFTAVLTSSKDECASPTLSAP